MCSLENKQPENIFKLLINEKTDIKQKDYNGKSYLIYLFENYSYFKNKNVLYLFIKSDINIKDIFN